MTHCCVGAATFGVVLVCGCAGSRTAGRSNFQQADRTGVVDLGLYAAPAGAERTYRRTPLGRGRQKATEYKIVQKGRQRYEGDLVGVHVGSIEVFLAKTNEAQGGPSFPWPDPHGKTHAPFFLKPDPPFERAPQKLRAWPPYFNETDVSYYNWAGEMTHSGTVGCETVFEGWEDVRVGRHVFQRCPRVQIDTWLRLPWVARLHVIEQVWLAEGVGMVRREVQWRGWVALLVRVSGGCMFELVSPIEKQKKAENAPQNEPPPYFGSWSCCAVYIQPSLPKPQLAGLIIEAAAANGAAEEGQRVAGAVDGSVDAP